MPLIDETVSELARTLWDARLQGRPCAAPTELFPGITIADAYRVSKTNVDRRSVAQKTRLVGRKIGLTSAAVQRQLAVEQPDFGYLTADMAVADGAALPPGALIQGKVEGEVAFLLKGGLRGPGVTREQVLAATSSFAASIEIIDSRVRDWKIRIQDTVADNASSAFFVLGPGRASPKALDLREARMLLRKNGEVASTGDGKACLGDPALAVAWLANALADFGEALAPGDVILSGAFGPVVPFAPGDSCEVEITGLGRVACRYDR